jgi:hypothetical protein
MATFVTPSILSNGSFYKSETSFCLLASFELASGRLHHDRQGLDTWATT